jgi:hypothetical protein
MPESDAGSQVMGQDTTGNEDHTQFNIQLLT